MRYLLRRFEDSECCGDKCPNCTWPSCGEHSFHAPSLGWLGEDL